MNDLANRRLDLGEAQELVEFGEGEIADTDVPREVLLHEFLHLPPNPFHVEFQQVAPLWGPNCSVPQPKGPMNLDNEILNILVLITYANCEYRRILIKDKSRKIIKLRVRDQGILAAVPPASSETPAPPFPALDQCTFSVTISHIH